MAPDKRDRADRSSNRFNCFCVKIINYITWKLAWKLVDRVDSVLISGVSCRCFQGLICSQCDNLTLMGVDFWRLMHEQIRLGCVVNITANAVITVSVNYIKIMRRWLRTFPHTIPFISFLHYSILIWPPSFSLLNRLSSQIPSPWDIPHESAIFFLLLFSHWVQEDRQGWYSPHTLLYWSYSALHNSPPLPSL